VDSRQTALRLDELDPLAPFRQQFVIDDPDLIYLDGNSLGRLPVATAKAVNDAVQQQWGRRLIRGWSDGWIGLSQRLGEKVGKIIGAEPGETRVCDSTSVNFFKLALAALQYQIGLGIPPRVVTEAGNFPSDLYLLQGLSRLIPGLEIVKVSEESDEAVIATLSEPTALLTLSHTSFRSARFYDMARLNAAAREVGALTLWDLSHSAGAVPLELAASRSDLAVGCGYKYLNGGPGAPAFLYVSSELQAKLENPIQGWFGHRYPFEFEGAYQPAGGIDRMLSGTPAVLSMIALEVGLDLVVEAGPLRIREKSIALTDFAIRLADEMLLPHGFALETPRDAKNRGSHVSLSHPDALRIDLALINQLNVIPDFRKPNILRLGFSPLTTSFTEVDEGFSRITRVVEERLFEREDPASVSVT